MTKTTIDSATEVRAGETLAVGPLAEYIREHLDGLRGDITVRQFPGGYSNLTYLIEMGGRELVLRRPPFGTKARTAHDMGREFRVLSALHPVFSYCPRPFFYCEDPAVLGDPFYVMERIKGTIVRKDYPATMALGSEQVRVQFRRLLEVFSELHGVDYAAAGLAGLGKPVGYPRRQVEGWSKRYVAARTDDAPDFASTMQWLHDNLPAEAGRAALIHNDFKMDNVVWDPDDPLRLTGVLDWEMATIGDPLMDLGCTLAYWTEAGDPDFMRAAQLMPSDRPGAPTRREAIEYYSTCAGIRVDNVDFYHCFGLFRLAVIAQQIYYRYFHGQTGDERFARLIRWVHGLDQMCERLLAGQRG